MKKWYELGLFTIFDLETTGLSPSRDRIVEIAAIRVDTDGHQIRFHSLVNPGVSIPQLSSRIHGITDETVASAPNFHTVGMDFIELANGSTLVAHNARFDLAFLQESLARTGRRLWQGKTLDSIPLIKQAYAGLPSYSLQALRIRFGLGEGTGTAHRADSDTEWTLEIFEMTMTTLLKASQDNH